MNLPVARIFLTLVIAAFAHVANAQQETAKDSVALWVRTMNGNEYVGYLEIRNSSEIQLRTADLGIVTIPFDQIRKIREVDPKNVNRPFPDFYSAFKSKYFTIQSARMLNKGDGYYQNGILLYNQAAFGITDHWSVSVSTFIPFALWFSTKAGFSISEGVHIAGNVSLGTQFEEGTGGTGSVGLFSGIITVGKNRFQATFGAGVLLEDGAFQNRAALQFGAMYQTGRRGYVIFEGNILDSDEFFDRTYLMGGRTRIRRIAIDYGVGFIDDNSDFLFLYPYVGIILPF
ncbi:hypothetical protein [Fulvivirga sedimenti]|uniref:Uncharacterized protein n=1 Tax=Fulvivirga sedimenti TaxID=2879465 RepID=A0A9X1KW14_9BACT|nr:hypothetical protein [Fulvivirga sedimenti]MCA6074255.1 hypothetical protein [Fulvivirga sedimenti]